MTYPSCLTCNLHSFCVRTLPVSWGQVLNLSLLPVTFANELHEDIEKKSGDSMGGTTCWMKSANRGLPLFVLLLLFLIFAIRSLQLINHLKRVVFSRNRPGNPQIGSLPSGNLVCEFPKGRNMCRGQYWMKEHHWLEPWPPNAGYLPTDFSWTTIESSVESWTLSLHWGKRLVQSPPASKMKRKQKIEMARRSPKWV